MSVALVTGASRGIGRALCASLTGRGVTVAGAARSTIPEGTVAIPLQMDLTSEESIAAAAAAFGRTNAGQKRLDLLVNCAAMMHPSGRGENTVARLKQEDMMSVMLTNLIGPALVVKHFLPYLRKGSNPKVIQVAAGVGSVSGNAAGGWYSYRLSKTALNQLTKNLGIELGRKGIISAGLYPEMVETDFSTPYQKNNPYDVLRTPEETAERMLDVIDKLEAKPVGQFINIWSEEQIAH